MVTSGLRVITSCQVVRAAEQPELAGMMNRQLIQYVQEYRTVPQQLKLLSAALRALES